MEFKTISTLYAPELYNLFKERDRESWISTQKMPSYQEHYAFVEHHPYRHWWLIYDDGKAVGSIYVGQDNSVGINIGRDYRRRGFAKQALERVLRDVVPLPETKSVRPGYFIANIKEGNEASEALFAACGFQPVQRTWALK